MAELDSQDSSANLKPFSIAAAMARFIESISRARSHHTALAYENAMSQFGATLADHGQPTRTTPLEELSEESISWFTADLKAYAPATERQYLTAASGFFEFLVAENLANVNLPRIRLLIRQRARRPGIRLPQFPREEIEAVLAHAENLLTIPFSHEDERLRNLRDRAFLLTLADTGLRVNEACGLRRGDIDWNEAQAVIVGKGDRQAVVRFSRRSLAALKDYLSARARIDGASGRPLPSLPLFARHDIGAGKKVKPITTRSGQNIVAEHVGRAIGPEAVGTITPHSFRHYFVTTVLRSSGNLKLAQELARHRNIAVTQRYAHLSDDELDKGYEEIFNA